MYRTLKALVLAAVTAGCFFHAAGANAGSGLNDETIFAIFDQANMADISTGRLGWKKGHASEVKALAKMVVTDHTAVQQMGRDLAGKLGFLGTPPDGDTSLADQAAALAKLQNLDGAAFDAAYLRHEIAFHQAVIDAINTVLLPAIKAAAFRKLVEDVLPGFEHHLAETKKTAKLLGVTY